MTRTSFTPYSLEKFWSFPSSLYKSMFEKFFGTWSLNYKEELLYERSWHATVDNKDTTSTSAGDFFKQSETNSLKGQEKCSSNCG